MDSILQGLDGVACYIDDILVTGKTNEEHLTRLEEVLRHLHKHGVHIKNPSVSSSSHVSFSWDTGSMHREFIPLRTKWRRSQEPKNVQELRSFLGLVNYGKFIRTTLNSLLCKDAPWEWMQQCQQSFDLAKETLTSSKVLMHYDSALPIRLIGDALAYGVGAVITHILSDGSEHPVVLGP